MIRLLIDNSEVVLPDGFSFTLYSENPIFNKSSDYTYDITLSLKNATNARIYKHINRHNIENNQIENREAILIVDNKIRFIGTEIILQISDSDVKIQLASGNSELNYLVGGDRKLRELDMGKAEPIIGIPEEGERQSDATSRAVLEQLGKTYPLRDWQLVSFNLGPDENEDEIYSGEHHTKFGNYFTYHSEIEPFPVGGLKPFYIPIYTGQIPQPYLCAIIRKTMEALGYRLTYNVLEEDEVLRNIYIVHGIRTMEFAKMLPDWTVSDFLSKIEFQFDCIFLVNPKDKTVRLVFTQRYDETLPTTTLKGIDGFKEEIDNENKLNPRVANMSYSLDTEDYYKYSSLNTAFVDLVKEKDKYVTVNSFEELWNKVKDSSDSDRFMKIFKFGDSEFIAYDTLATENGTSKVVPIKVNFLRPLINDSKTDTIDYEADIIPAAMTKKSIIAYTGNLTIEHLITFQVPIAGNYDEFISNNDDEDTDDYNLQNLIEGTDTLTQDASGYTKMRIAIYPGITYFGEDRYPGIITAVCPMAYVESLYEEYSVTGKERYLPGTKNPLRLTSLYKNIYSNGRIIDTTRKCKISFIYTDDFDITSRFIINNKAYICSKIELNITNEGITPLVMGEFYAIE